MNDAWLLPVVAVAATLIVAVIAASIVYSRSDGAPQIGQGWTDPCASVPDTYPLPLDWRFSNGVQVVASGRCP